MDQIKRLEDLIPLEAGSKIKSYLAQRLTASGENLGSLMLSVDISLETQNGIKDLHVVAKMIPPNEHIQDLFNTQVTFRNEIAFFKNIVPLLQNFQREHGVKAVIDFAAKYYGSRLNLNNDDSIVDGNAALVLENLKFKGYETFNRLEGLNLEAAKLVFSNLAQFHAVPLALRLQKPDVFEREIKKYLTPWQLKHHLYEQTKRDQSRLIDEVPELQSLRERIFRGFDRGREERKPRELFATLVHNDLWSNNNMFKVEGGKMVKSKMVDFQIMCYGSPARDVVFFIFSTLTKEVVEEHYDDLLKFYFESFIATLKSLHCDTISFTWDAFLKDIDYEAKYAELEHLGFMLYPLYAPKESTLDFTNFSPDNWKVNEFTNLHKEKYVFVYKQFEKRGWI